LVGPTITNFKGFLKEGAFLSKKATKGRKKPLLFTHILKTFRKREKKPYSNQEIVFVKKTERQLLFKGGGRGCLLPKKG